MLGAPVPAHDKVTLAEPDATEAVPTEYRADAVVVLSAADEPVLALIVEPQRHRDPKKRWSWPVYVTNLRARLRCPAEVLVVSPDASVAAWSATPIPVGVCSSQITPLVLGPDLIPVVTDAGQAELEPELTVLSAVAHGGDPQRRGVLDALFAALPSVEEQRQVLYLEAVYAALPAAARSYLEGLVMSTDTHEEMSEFRQWLISVGEAKGKEEGKAEGKAQGEARAVLTVLDARRIDVPEQARRRITGCADADQLDVWVRRAVTADTVEDLFDE